MRALDLFSGIGGFSLGLERAGVDTAAFCEIDEACRKVLAVRWPRTPCYDDVKKVTKQQLTNDGIGDIDIICGGFPCQDISLAGKGAGLEGDRSGLWWEFHRIINDFQPRWAIIENVSALRSRGLDAVLGSLAQIGYDAEWHCVPASAIGAPHRRDRLWIIAYPNSDDGRAGRPRRPDTGCPGQQEPQRSLQEHLAHPNSARLEVRIGSPGLQATISTIKRCGGLHGWWRTEPDVGRVAHGVPHRVDRLRQLGNAVVPQIPELIARHLF